MRSRPARWLAAALALISLCLALSWLLLPSYVRRVASEQVQQQLGRKLTIDAVYFSPFRLVLTADGVTLYEADRRTPALQVRQLMLNLSLASLFRRALIVDEVQLRAPQLHLVRSSGEIYGHYNFNDILEKIAAMPKSDTPLRFSLANLQLIDGAIAFDDQVIGKQFKLEALQIGLPFLSNFPAASDIFVQPMLSARVDGSVFTLQGRAKPFADAQEAALAIDLEQLDIARYAGYFPRPLPLQIQSGRLSSKLDLIFSRKNRQPELLLSGELRLQDVALQDVHAAPLLKLASLQAQIRQINVMNSAASLDNLQLNSPELWLDIDRQGSLNWARLLASSVSVPSADAGNKTASPAAPRLSLNELHVQQGQLHLRDAWHAAPLQAVTLKAITLASRQLSNGADAKPSPLNLSLQGEHEESLQFDGELQPMAATLKGQATLKAWPLAAYQPFLNKMLAAKLAGQLGASAQVQLQSGRLQLDQLALTLDDFSIQPAAGRDGGITLKSLALDKLSLDTAGRNIAAGSLQLNGLRGDIRRDPQAMLNVQKWLRPAGTSATGAAAAKAGTAGKTLPAWKIALSSFALKDSALSFSDQAVTPAVTLKAEALSLDAERLSSDWSQAGKLRLQANVNRKGKLGVSGDIAPQLKNIVLNLDAQSLPVAALYPYFSSYLNVSLTRGHASAKGRLSVSNALAANRSLAYEGMLSLNDFHMLENGASEDFLEWKNISLEGIAARLGGGKPVVSMKKLALNDFYARAILSEKGKLNLQNIVVGKPEDSAAGSAADAGKHAAPLAIRIAQTTMRGGNINFTDNFIKPNYSANLTGVSGSIGALASDDMQAATVELNGKIDRDAPLTISGTVHPLASPVFLDIKGSAYGIELTRLTPYAAKYAGYAIDKGKLAMQATYHVENRQLQAENEIRLDQLSFGERVESPDATHLPVMLAVALLRDNNGQIAINLPISGSLNDPQFSVGGIIVRVFTNLITKAVTSPFALLGSLFGGGEELAYAEFSAGQATLTPAATAKLDSLVKALQNRAGLKLDIIGRVEPVSDSEGVRRELLLRKLRELKWQDVHRNDNSVRIDELSLSEDEHKKYVEQVYRSEKFSKPRNLIGLAKTLPMTEAEHLILSNTVVTPDALRMLAQKRADAVRDYLEQKGEISPERLFLIAPRLNADGIKDKGAPNRVDFALR
ncbi:MAG: DUF748 domain-containing protein [Burkholderiales bacterium]|nr:DUF748 domain-containing protein [Burkholderiales bacterium]